MTNSSESETALFPAKKGQNPPLIFPILKMTPKDAPKSFLLHFYVTIYPIPSQNCKKIFNSNTFPRFFFQIAQKLPAPKIFARHRKVPNRHFPANPPLLVTLAAQHVLTWRYTKPQSKTNSTWTIYILRANDKLYAYSI